MDGRVPASFAVHIQALVDLAERLSQDADEIKRPVQAVADIGASPELPLGAFAEAFSLSDDHGDLTAQMTTVLGTLARAVEFAATATKIVADRYQVLEDAGAGIVAASIGQTWPTFTGSAAVPPRSLAPPDPRFVQVVVPATGGTVYVSSSTPGAGQIAVTVEAQTT